MTLIDFGHLSARLMHTAISHTAPKVNKETGKFDTSDWIPMFAHLLLKNLSYLKMKFEHEYGELVICVDNRSNWRKDVYPEYKGNRKGKRDESNIDYAGFYAEQDIIISYLEEHFPFRVLLVDKCEADDIVGILAKKYSAVEKTVVVSSDKDFKQVLEYGARLFDPMTKVFVTMTQEQLKEWKVEHILFGDKADNIPSIKDSTEFTPEFKNYLSENGVYKDIPVIEFLDMEMSKDLFNRYTIYEMITAGKLKGQLRDVKKIYKKPQFGEKGAYKFAKDLKENIKDNPLYIRHFKRNQVLVLFDKIPEEIQADILKSYKESSNSFNTTGIMELMTKYNMIDMMRNVSDFFQSPKQTKQTNTELDAWS
jgi:5'-3' exonuclease